MRTNELIRATENTKIYLDMDGVLADFFVEYAKLAGIESGNYRDIPPAKQDPTLDKMVGTDFFSRLPKFPTADNLVKLVLKYVKSYGICSSPLRGDFKNSEMHKRKWLKSHLNPQPAEIIITGQKERYAVNADGSPNILIDDRSVNCVAWRNHGGIAIKYQADEDSLKKVADGLAMAYGQLGESVDVNYGIGKNPGALFTIGNVYGKKNTKVPHARLHVNTKNKKRLGIPK
jgi:hypothetical protein